MSRCLQSHALSCDILVAGGGLSGVCCAIAAARRGADVVLVQDRSVLGGNASSEIRMHALGAQGGRKGEPLALEAREGGIMEEIRLENSVRNPQRCASMLDLILYEFCLAEPNLSLYLDTCLTAVEMDGDRIGHAIAERQSTEDRFRIAARIFIDCTGDGRLGAEAGAPYRWGREGREVFDEPHAQGPDKKTLGSSILFTASRHDKPMPFTPPPWARKVREEDLNHRPHGRPGVDRGLEYGYWWLEWGGQLDAIKDNEGIRQELLSILMGVWDHVKNSGEHDADPWAFNWFGFLPAKRESRRFEGIYTMTEHDVGPSRPQPDAITHGGWAMDMHPPEGIDRSDIPPINKISVPRVYDVPLRACISWKVPNLMFAGRNVSASHVAFSSMRVMATCAAMGQGVGTAAAQAVQEGLQPGDLAADASQVQRLQQQLLRDDMYLLGVRNEDSADLARQATVRAASARPGGDPDHVLSGQTRSLHAERGNPERSPAGTHRWMSDPDAGLPAWIELSWDQPIRPREVQLVFDTGLHRVLTLSHSEALVQHMEYGRPQSETVRDYRIEGLTDGRWQDLAEVTGNYQRRRRHAVDPAGPVEAVRVHVSATNGLDHARIAEIRVYE